MKSPSISTPMTPKGMAAIPVTGSVVRAWSWMWAVSPTAL
jgi:hypothetical protein